MGQIIHTQKVGRSPGLAQFPANWSALVTTLDLRSPPDMVPGLPDNSVFRLSKWTKAITRASFLSEKVIAQLIILILFGPTYLFRLTLKSTFLLYWPLLFVASAPSALKTDDGSLIWDDARGRRLIDWIAAALALGALVAIGSTIYDPSFFAAFIAWADPRDLPSHVLLQAFSFKIWELDLWEWFALLASAITLTVFVWANAINIRHRGSDRQPGWATLKTIYALNRAKALFVAATILTSLFAMVWFVHDSCTMPDLITGWLTPTLGAPQSCISAATIPSSG